MQSATQRPFEVVVWGATGFTGRLVCEHIVKSYPGQVRWAMAGRNKERLEQVKRDLVRLKPDCEQEIKMIIADGNDMEALTTMAAQTSVIIAMAGPFAKYSAKVVEAAVKEGTHYCDITGEAPWVRSNIDRFHEEAAAKGTKIVHCCGFDSVPSDLGTLLVVDHIHNKLHKTASQIYAMFGSINGTASGGTIATMFAQMETSDKKEVGKQLQDAYYLAPRDARKGNDKPSPLRPTWNPFAKKYMAPFFMEVVNGRIVHRSAALRPELYGTAFKYQEGLALGSSLAAGATSFATVLGGAVMGLSPLRWVAKKLLPAPGEGPDEAARNAGYWNIEVMGLTAEEAGKAPEVVVGKCSHHNDPGYGSTSRMVLEAGLCLARQAEECDAAGCLRGGILTPASAMGMVLVDRLRKAGFTFEIKQSPALKAEPLVAAVAQK